METTFMFAAALAIVYAIFTIARNRLSTEYTKPTKEIAIDSSMVFLVTLATAFVMDSFGFASIISLQKGSNTAAFTKKPDF